MTSSTRVLQLPGWQGSDAEHWQSRWEATYGDERVEQSDWSMPLRGDWMTRLEDVLGGISDRVVLVGHSLGCHLVASWAAHSQNTAPVVGAFLVAPPDTERAEAPPNLFSWRPMTTMKLPFPSFVVSSSDDPYCDPIMSANLARAWGSTHLEIGAFGHINSQSSLGQWPAGRQLFQTWLSTL